MLAPFHKLLANINTQYLSQFQTFARPYPLVLLSVIFIPVVLSNRFKFVFKYRVYDAGNIKVRTIATQGLINKPYDRFIDDIIILRQIILFRPPSQRPDAHIILSHLVPQLLTFALNIYATNLREIYPSLQEPVINIAQYPAKINPIRIIISAARRETFIHQLFNKYQFVL